MSMIGSFYALKDADLEEIIKLPKRIHSLWGGPQATKRPSLLSRLLGGKSRPPALAPQDEWQVSKKPTTFDVDKAWQGIHFLLTGSDWEGEGPLSFILQGGREIAEDLGYGSPHGFSSSEVKVIDDALRDIDGAALFERADPAEFTKLGIYPEVWDRESKEECIGYLIEHFNGLKKFVREAAQSESALIAYIG